MHIFSRPLFTFLFLISSCFAALNVRAEDDVKVGAILHLTGDLAMPSAAFREGIELAVDKINAGNLAGKKITVLFEDGKNNPNASFTAAKKLLELEKVPVSIISSHLDAVSSAQLFEKRKTPVLVLWDSNPIIDALGDYIFAIGPWTPSAGEASANYATKILHGQRAAIFYNRDPWSETVTDSFRKKFTEQGGEIAAEFPLNPDEVDFRSVITKVKSLQVDFIYTPLVFNLLPFYSQLKELALNKPIVTSDIIADEHIQQAPQVFEGIYQTNLPEPTSPQFVQMKEQYQKKFGKPVSMGWFVGIGYDAMNIIAQAIRTAGADSHAIQQELYKIKDFPGATTSITINEKGTCPQYEVMYQIQKGKFVQLALN
jgi:branched-chain amino acid transport system substrate-binding protein